MLVHGTVMCILHYNDKRLMQTGLIVSSRWPDTQPVDELVIKSSTYLMEAVHDLRKRLKAVTDNKKVYYVYIT